jgi:homoserine kinase type II
MALLTPLSAEEARAVLAAYGLALDSITPLPSKGTVNSNFRVRASGADWFLRINEGKRDDDVAAEAELVAHLAERGLPTAAIKRTALGEWLTHAAGKPVTLFAWLEGHEAHPDPARPETVAVCGHALGLLHNAGADLGPARCPRNHYTLDELERRLASFAGDARLADVVPKLQRELDRARARDRRDEGLIHQDLFPDNVLVDGSGALVAVLDLEQATCGSYLYDLAVCANAWCWDGRAIVSAAVDAITAAYARHRAFSSGGFVAEAALAAARFTITRVTDIFLRSDVDPDLRRRKDYRDYLNRLDYWLSLTSG